MAELSVRPAGAEDAAAISQVRLESWRAAYRELIPESVFARYDWAVPAARWAQRLADDRIRSLVAEVDGALAGFVNFGAGRDVDLPGASEVYAIYVRPQSQSNGIGRALLSAAVDATAARPVTLWVLRGNDRARHFYDRAGWTPDGAEQDAELLGGLRLPEVRYRLD